MASLKEIRNRIKSISSTRKITSAMKMVSSAKLKKAQNAIENSLLYVSKLNSILNHFIASLDREELPALCEVRETQRVVIIAVSSNSSLSGAFNNNVVKAFMAAYQRYEAKIGAKNITVYAIGRKIREAIDNAGIQRVETELDSAHPDYVTAQLLMRQLMERFTENKIDRVDFISNHFKSVGVQIMRNVVLLPYAPVLHHDENPEESLVDYIVEPNKGELINDLLSKVIELNFFTGLQDSLAAEHAARTTAMQIATDNADELIKDLRVNYNKLRQSSITNELITITGGAEALKH